MALWGSKGTPYAGLKVAQLDGMELVHGTLLARAAEALAMNQDV